MAFLGCKHRWRLGEDLYFKEVENEFAAARIYTYNCFLKSYSVLQSLCNRLTSRVGRFTLVMYFLYPIVNRRNKSSVSRPYQEYVACKFQVCLQSTVDCVVPLGFNEVLRNLAKPYSGGRKARASSPTLGLPSF